MAISRSKALQLFVYISRTSARGTSPFLLRYPHNQPDKKKNNKIINTPTHEHRDIPSLLIRFLSGVREERVQPMGDVLRCGR